MSKRPVLEMEFTDTELFLRLNGVRIAKRQNKQWISLDPEWEVRQSPNLEYIDVRRRIGGAVQ